MINSAVSENRPEAASLIAQEASRTYLHLYLYERPYEKDEEEENQWLRKMASAAAKVLSLPFCFLYYSLNKFKLF